MAEGKKEGVKKEKLKEAKVSIDNDQLQGKLAVEFITRFYRLLKGTTLYDQKNVIIDRLAQVCVEMINPILSSEGHLFLKVVRDNFFFNNLPPPGRSRAPMPLRTL